MKPKMKFFGFTVLLFSLLLLFFVTSDVAFAQQKQKPEDKGYVDTNKDGINDNAKDDDGDGIPNGKDADYVRPQDGSGQQKAAGKKVGTGKRQDEDGVRIRNKNQLRSKFWNKAEKQNRFKGFADENGDGINDNAPDSDGDGIPNGQDPDYNRQNPGRGKWSMGFVDEDGDGINDRAMDDDGDGIPNGKDSDYVKPRDGSGRKVMKGVRSNGRFSGDNTGECDGSGPKGKSARGGKN